MYTVNNFENIIVINKSKFITNLFFVENIDDIDNYFNMIKKKYKDATHNCYAYIINNIKKCSDNGEPNGTAGKPILDILEKNNLNYVLCITTRYYGGIKLGANGLIRAYSNCTSKAIEKAELLKVLDGYNIEISFDYNKKNNIDDILENTIINNKIYDKKITYNVDVSDYELNKLKELNININIISNKIIKKIRK